MDAEIAIEVAYDNRPHGLVFVVGDRSVQHIYVRNLSARVSVMIKIQSTSSRKFRVRPGLALVAPHASVAVQIQLAPHEREASECKFLLVARRVDLDDDALVGTVTARPTTLEAAQQQRDADDKARWQRAEARHHDSLLFSETIVAQIVLEPTVPDIQDACPIVLSVDSLEARARVVLLMMKNRSRHHENKLSADERTALQRLRAENAVVWEELEDDARRMRALARQYAQQKR